jgi:hypothetical protein
MPNYALIDTNGLIVNRIILDDVNAWARPEGCTIQPEPESGYAIGGTFLNGVYTVPTLPPLPPPLIPASISDRQFFQQLAVQGIITQADALAAIAAVIPPALSTLINAMPADQQFNAKMIVSGATTFFRDNPLTVAIGTAYGMSSAQIDAFFTAAAAL